MNHWQQTEKTLWQGRDDSAESPNAKRLHQIVQVANTNQPPPNVKTGDIALLGFQCDEGVRRNKGRQGAKRAPIVLRQALANLAFHGDNSWWDGGDIICQSDKSGGDLEDAQLQFADLVTSYQTQAMPTLVLGGGHETAYAHGLGIYQAHPEKRLGIINFDAHLDMRSADEATSGTPFLQLAQQCQINQQEFHYLCVGASKAANTSALIDNANEYGANIIWDDDCFDTAKVISQITDFISRVDIIYLTIDLDALSASQMFAVSAPAALGIPLFEIMQWTNTVLASGKLCAGDVVEYNPDFDRDLLCARVAARLIWQMGQAYG